MKKVNVKAYAKINLYLDVVSKMNNGFHSVESVMQSISLADDVSVEADFSQSTDITVKCGSTYAPDGADNIAYRAAKHFLDHADIKASVCIEITKNIPSPAGMGGGSSDAAAVLRGLNSIFNVFSISELESIAAEIGSDVPFCVKGRTQIARGRGEVLDSCKDIPPCFFVIGCGEDLLSTPEAYRMLDKRFNNFTEPTIIGGMDRFIEFMTSIEKMANNMYNVFECVTVPVCPSVAKIKTILSESGSFGTLMCGSGPAVFGVFADESSALLAAENVKKKGYFASVCTPVYNID